MGSKIRLETAKNFFPNSYYPFIGFIHQNGGENLLKREGSRKRVVVGVCFSKISLEEKMLGPNQEKKSKLSVSR